MKQSEYLQLVLNTLGQHGWSVTGFDDEEEFHTLVHPTFAEVLDHAKSVDQSALEVSHPLHGRALLFLLWQGPDDRYPAGEEFVYNYSVKLEPFMPAGDA